MITSSPQVALDTSDTGYASSLLFAPEIQDAMEDLTYTVSAGFFAFLLLLGYALYQLILLGFQTCKVQISVVQQESAAYWLLSTIAGLTYFIVTVIFIDAELLFGDSLFPARRSGEADLDWRQTLAWVEAMQGFMIYFGWAVLPLVAIYFIQIFRGPVQTLLVAHHVMVVLVLFYGLQAFMSTLNPLWLQTGIYMFSHVGMEFPIWLALLTYRFQWRYASLAMGTAIVYEVVLRLSLWVMATIVYVHLTWTSDTFTRWELVWRWVYPLVLLLQLVTEVQVTFIHMSLYRKLSTTTKLKTEEAAAQERIDEKCSNSRHYLTDDDGASDDASDDDVDDEDIDEIDVVIERRLSGIRLDDEHGGARRSAGDSSVFLVLAVAVAFGAVVMAGESVFSVHEHGHVEKVRPNQRIAVIGGGIAGLGTAWALKTSNPENQYHVTIFEEASILGGAASTHYYGEGEFIDLAVAAFNRYHNFEILLDLLDIKTKQGAGETRTVFGMTVENRTVSGPSLPHYFNDKNRFLGIADQVDLFDKLLSVASEEWNEEQLMTTTLAEFLSMDDRFTDEFALNYLSICFQTYVATGASTLDMPLALTILFEKRFGLCSTPSRVAGRFFADGAYKYVEALQEVLQQNGSNKVDIRLKSPVNAIRKRGSNILVLSANGEWDEFDHVVFALKRHQVHAIFNNEESAIPLKSHGLYDSLFGGEMEGEFSEKIIFNQTRPILNLYTPLMDEEGCFHLDAYNFLQFNDSTEQTFLEHDANRIIMPVHDNAFDNSCRKDLGSKIALRVSEQGAKNWEMLGLDHAVESKTKWWHSSHSVNYFQRGRSTHAVQGMNNIWFAGCDIVVNFHEESFVSGLVIAHALGAGYAFKDYAAASGLFRKVHGWMLYGINFLVLPNTKRHDG